MGSAHPDPLENIMKIGNPEGKGPLNPAGPARTQAGEAGKTETTAPGVDASAKVELSEAATLIGDSASPSEFDAAKVARIAQAITDGSYKINAEAIADKLIANAQELLGKTPH
jgi:negative regulator of flagellin synthesis FlgM